MSTQAHRTEVAADRVDLAGSATMRAIVQDTYGSAEVLHIAQAPKPSYGDKEVLVRVRAAGLDRGTWHLMTGKPYLQRPFTGLRGPRKPVSGRDLAGTVEAVGAAVTRFAPGDEVFGIAPGSFAEYAVAKENKLVRKPRNLTFEQAAVVPVSALTALRAVTDVGRVEAGQHVLILGASGGVGSYAVQLAKAYGAEVTAVCSAAKHDLVRALGADHVLDYAVDDFAAGTQRYDLIIDIAGNPTLSRLRSALTSRGTVALVGGEGGGSFSGGMGRGLRGVLMSPFVRHRLVMVMPTERGSDIERLAELITAGKIIPSVDRSYPLDQAPEAMRRLEAGDVRGKIAITI